MWLSMRDHWLCLVPTADTIDNTKRNGIKKSLKQDKNISKWSKHFRDMQWSWKADVQTNHKRPCMRAHQHPINNLENCTSCFNAAFHHPVGAFLVQSPLIKAADREIHLFLQSVVSSLWDQWQFIDDPSVAQEIRLLNWFRLSWKTAQQIEICLMHHPEKAAVTNGKHVCDALWMMKCSMDDLPCG